MVKFDLKSLSVQELKSLQKKVEREMSGRDKRQRKEALIAVREKAKELGFSLNELVGDGGEAAGAGASSATTRAPAPAKYRSKDDPTLTWSGRGRPPLWIKEAQDKGVDLETLRIDS